MMTKKIFISTSSFGQYDATVLDPLRKEGFIVEMNPYRRRLHLQESKGLYENIDYLIAGIELLNRDIFEVTRKLKVISRCGVGLDNVDLKAAEEFGIKVYNTPGAPTLAVAELTLGLILSLLRKIPSMDRNLRQGHWQKQMGHLLFDKKIGIIGFGQIGQKVAELLLPFGVHLAYHDISKKESHLPCEFKELMDLLGWADVITLHCSLCRDKGEVILGKKEIERMRQGSWLINASRGELVDQEALEEALRTKFLAGAALDVFDEEPYQGPLRNIDNVILTPHIGSYAKEARILMEKAAVENLIKGINVLAKIKE